MDHVNNHEDPLSSIRFINMKDLRLLSSFPRCPDNDNICANIDDIDRSKSLFIFISHCWLRGWNGSPGYDMRPHPDNVNNDKFQLVVEVIDKYLIKQAPGMEDVYVWIDYGCINQNLDPAGELKQLDKIVQSCDMILTIVADSFDNEWKSWHLPLTISNWYKEYMARAWNDGEFGYLNRCWCRVEMIYAANVPLSDDTADRSQHFTAGLLEAVKVNRRPHYLYGTREKMRNGAPRALPPLRNTFIEEYHPLAGSITKESDREKIKELIEALQPYIDANQATVGYIGKRNLLGQRHGKGTFTSDNGDVYVGEWEDDKRNGQGTYTYADGDVYTGNFKDGLSSGYGTCTYADGDKYVGEWKDDSRSGQGTYTSANGNVFVGEFKDGRRHGQGTFTFAFGDVYVGEFKSGKRHGHGTYNYTRGDVYVGEYKDDLKNGKGRYTYTDGDVYVGEFKDDNMNGHGTYTSPNGDAYDGEWKDNKKNGQGTFKFSNGNVYNGAFRDDCRSGYGTLTVVRGDIYVGNYKNDKKNGQGTYIFANGSVFDGAWYNGQMSGHGSYTEADGTVQKGTFKNGIFIGSKDLPVSL